MLLLVGRKVDFEFYVSNWLGGGGDGLLIVLEVVRLLVEKMLCVFGDKDEDVLCLDLLVNDGVRKVKLLGDYYFGGDYDCLVEVIFKGGM